jgi:hypothetical protein
MRYNIFSFEDTFNSLQFARHDGGCIENVRESMLGEELGFSEGGYNQLAGGLEGHKRQRRG